MVNVIEDERNEFKVKLNDRFEEEVIAFLNSNGGNIFIGIDDNGNIKGLNGNLDLLQRTIKDRIKDNVMPSTIGLYDVSLMSENDKKYIQVTIAKGMQQPYYLKGMGMTPDSCFIRIGSAVSSMTNEMIQNTFSKRTRSSLRNIVSPEQNLLFSQLKIYYEEKGFTITNSFLKQLNLYNDDNKYNYIAYLLADNNDISVQFAKYNGDDVYNLIENEDYGFCSIIKIANNILSKLKIENKTYTKLSYSGRNEIKMFNFDAIKELVTNALVHNDWSNGYSPKFEIFDNKLVISSNGGIQEGINQEDFLLGFSNPRNQELMRVFRDLELVEQLGTGIQRVLKVYKRDIFEFYPNHIRVTVPFKENGFEKEYNNINHTNSVKELTEIQKSIMKLMMDKPYITQDELSKLLDVNKRTIIRHLKPLIDNNCIVRIGANKNGYWQINLKI